MSVVQPEAVSAATTLLNEFAPYRDNQDPNLRTHIVSPPENHHITRGDTTMEAQQIVDEARMLGLEVIALCGHKWIPVHNPENYEACQPCFDRAAEIMKGLGE